MNDRNFMLLLVALLRKACDHLPGPASEEDIEKWDKPHHIKRAGLLRIDINNALAEAEERFVI